ncbi:lactate racemase domain-containing protein [Salinirubrum litoreum]|uniref:Lactate racemase domain-containing protein n=1 Tax=Salinirubrum litoreum TaxID=1126234 RepID=A0ABD5RB90_9EURY|nr:lactate racemase domain-containing protein [Salinirubrum litoreum]
MELPLGEGTVPVSLPDCEVTVAEPPGGPVVTPREAAERALDDPHGPALGDLVAPDDEVAVVVTDVTRATPDGVLLDAMLSRLPVAREQVTVVLGLGLHRPMTDAEIEAGLGEYADLAVNHDPGDTVVVGEIEGCEIELNSRVAGADTVLSTGMVEPHQYAGFSGGAKTVVIGAGGESLIRYTHGPELLSREGVRLGGIADNPFRETLDRAGDLAGLDFCLNVTKGPDGFLGASAGRPRDVVRDLADIARDALSVPVSTDYDAVVAGVGAPKDANLYQTTRAITYLVLGDRNPLRPGGRVVVPARLQEGAGEGAGERRFAERLASAESAAALYEEMRAGYEPGAQRAFVVARALRDHEAWITNSESPEVVSDCLLHPAESVADAVEPGSEVLVVRDALNTLLVDDS